MALKKTVSAYLKRHNLESTVNAVVNRLVRDRPDNPYEALADLFKAESNTPKGITGLRCSIGLDTLGRPCFEVSVTTDQGTFVGICPSGADPVLPVIELPEPEADAAAEAKDAGEAKAEAPVPRTLKFQDGKLGQSVLPVVSLINSGVASALKGIDPTDQAGADALIVQKFSKLSPKLDAIKQPGMFAVSMAVCRAGASAKGLPLYRHIAELNGYEDVFLPIPVVSVIKGGARTTNAANKLAFQELSIVPTGAKSFSEAILLSHRTFNRVKDGIVAAGAAAVPTENGSFDPPLASNEAALKLVHEAVMTSGCGDKVGIGVCVGASQYFTPPTEEEKAAATEDEILGSYVLSKKSASTEEAAPPTSARKGKGKGKDKAADKPVVTGPTKLTTDELTQFYRNMMQTYPIAVLEDLYDNKANQAWSDFTEETGQNVHIVGDSFIQMVAADDDGEGGDEGKADDGDDDDEGDGAPVDRMKAAAMGKCCNGVTLRLAADFQTLSQAFGRCREAHQLNYGIRFLLTPHDTGDTFVSDFVVGMQIGNIKAGGLIGCDRTAKYSRLLSIEAELGKQADYVGKRYTRALS